MPSFTTEKGAKGSVTRHAATPGAFTMTVTDPLSGNTFVIPANCNGFVEWEYTGGQYRWRGTGFMFASDTGWTADTGTTSKGALGTLVTAPSAAYVQAEAVAVANGLIELQKQVVALKAAVRAAGIITYFDV